MIIKLIAVLPHSDFERRKRVTFFMYLSFGYVGL
jgi:hypothetical protein